VQNILSRGYPYCVIARYGFHRTNRKTLRIYDAERCKERNAIEHFFNKLKQFGRIATRYDKPLANFARSLELLPVSSTKQLN